MIDTMFNVIQVPMKPQVPPGPVVRNEIEQAAFDNGWRVVEGVQDGWFLRRSTSAPGTVAIAGAGKDGPWFLAVDHPGVAEELDLEHADVTGPGVVRFVLADTAQLHFALGRAWDLARSLPEHPLRWFQGETAELPRETEVERQVVQRKGQDIFRESLMAYWDRRCPLTGITDPDLLRASHMKPWSDCDTDAERLDPYNGLLLSALWDAAFDSGLVSFDTNGRVLRSGKLSDGATGMLGSANALELTNKHHAYLDWHRRYVFKD